VVGGSAAGLSAALHLAPLVQRGLISGPIDVFDAPGIRPTDREIGVGIWSTALDPFACSERQSHALLYEEMSCCGTWVGDVGYRSPDGTWLLRNRLPVPVIRGGEGESAGASDGNTTASNDTNNMASLLFLREKDFLSSLKKAAHLEEQLGTLCIHREKGTKTKVCGLEETSSKPWSCRLSLGDFSHFSERDYHLIIAADGTHSTLRSTYGGHSSIFHPTSAKGLLTSGSSIPTPSDEQFRSSAEDWNESQQLQAVELQDRGYAVFRGNSPLKSNELSLRRDNNSGGGSSDTNSISFQTWGKRNRFVHEVRAPSSPPLCRFFHSIPRFSFYCAHIFPYAPNLLVRVAGVHFTDVPTKQHAIRDGAHVVPGERK